jgi:serine protease AprX
MLEANPQLTPQQVKRILIETAERLPGVEIDRQGWGVIAPRRAVEVALSLRPQ